MPRIVDVDQRRMELADAAARVIARSGIDSATMREIAAEAGWTTGTLVHYFANKHELLDFTLRTSLERRGARQSSRDQLSPAAALRETLIQALPIDDDTRVHWIVTVALVAAATSDEQLAATQRDAYRRYRASVVAILLDITPTTMVAAMSEAERLIGLVDGIAIQALFDPASWPAPRQLDALDMGLSAAWWNT